MYTGIYWDLNAIIELYIVIRWGAGGLSFTALSQTQPTQLQGRLDLESKYMLYLCVHDVFVCVSVCVYVCVRCEDWKDSEKSFLALWLDIW